MDTSTNQAIKHALIRQAEQFDALILQRIAAVNNEGYGTSSEHAKEHLRGLRQQAQRLSKW